MKGFISLQKEWTSLIQKIISSPLLHSKWVNTLSYLENCGARKIAACEHPTLVKEEMLKHAAEEFRHAHYLKRQLARLSGDPMDTYSLSYMLGGIASLHYLHALDVRVSRYLKTISSPEELKAHAYLLVTYAIEKRAEELYPIYDALLRKMHSPITVKSILLEEKEHLAEMEKGLLLIPNGVHHARQACTIEGIYCKTWIVELSKGCSA